MAPFVGREPLIDLYLLLHHRTGRRLAADPLLRHVRIVSRAPHWLLRSPHLNGVRMHWGCQPSDLALLQTVPAGRHITDMILSHWRYLDEETLLAVETARLLADSLRLASLRELSISTDYDWNEAAPLLTNSPHLSPTLKLVWYGEWKPSRRLARLLRARFPGPPAVG